MTAKSATAPPLGHAPEVLSESTLFATETSPQSDPTAAKISPRTMNRFQTMIIDPIVHGWKEAKSNPKRNAAPAVNNNTEAVTTSTSLIENQNVVAFVHVVYGNVTVASRYYKAVSDDFKTIIRPIPQTVIDDARECWEYLMSRDESEFKQSATWFRVNPHPQEIKDMTDIGFKAFFSLRQKQKEEQEAKGLPVKFISPINNIVAGYLKRVLARVTEGIVTESMRKMICGIYAEYPVGDTIELSKADGMIIERMFELNPQRKEIVEMVARLAHKILEHDPVEASSLAVVLPVTNVNAYGGGASTSEAVMKRGNVSKHEVADASEMRALLVEFDSWNRVLGSMFHQPSRFFS